MSNNTMGDLCPHCGHIIVWDYNLVQECQVCGEDVNDKEEDDD